MMRVIPKNILPVLIFIAPDDLLNIHFERRNSFK